MTNTEFIDALYVAGWRPVADYGDERAIKLLASLVQSADSKCMCAGLKLAGWFREMPSAMSYRLWEQGGHQRDPKNINEVALYEA